MIRIVTIMLAAAVALGAASAARADDASALAAVEEATRTLDKAFEHEDKATIRSLMTADHIAVAPVYGGSATIEEQFALFPDISYTAYHATEPAAAFLGPQTVLVTYRVEVKGTFRGNPLPSSVFVTAIWVKQDGQWLQRLYQETPTTIP